MHVLGIDLLGIYSLSIINTSQEVKNAISYSYFM